MIALLSPLGDEYLIVVLTPIESVITFKLMEWKKYGYFNPF
jgi:hypothetical protein